MEGLILFFFGQIIFIPVIHGPGWNLYTSTVSYPYDHVQKR